MADMINHPPHYTQHPSGVECIQVTEHFNFNIGNAIKYLWRSGLKGATVDDLKKAAWYVNREIERLGQGDAWSPQHEECWNPCWVMTADRRIECRSCHAPQGPHREGCIETQITVPPAERPPAVESPMSPDVIGPCDHKWHQGNGNNQPIVCRDCGAISWPLSVPVSALQALAARFTADAEDLRLHGESDRAAGIEACVRALEALITSHDPAPSTDSPPSQS